jgi:hypothetical protein
MHKLSKGVAEYAAGGKKGIEVPQHIAHTDLFCFPVRTAPEVN